MYFDDIQIINKKHEMKNGDEKCVDICHLNAILCAAPQIVLMRSTPIFGGAEPVELQTIKRHRNKVGDVI